MTENSSSSICDTRYRSHSSFDAKACLQKIKCKSCGCFTKNESGSKCKVCGQVVPSSKKNINTKLIKNQSQQQNSGLRPRSNSNTSDVITSGTTTTTTSQIKKYSHYFQEHNTSTNNSITRQNSFSTNPVVVQDDGLPPLSSNNKERSNSKTNNTYYSSSCYREEIIHDIYDEKNSDSSSTKMDRENFYSSEISQDKIKCNCCGSWIKKEKEFCYFCKRENVEKIFAENVSNRRRASSRSVGRV